MNTISRRFAALLAFACLSGASAADAHPTPERLIQLAAVSPDFDCYNAPYCIVRRGDISPDEDGSGAYWSEDYYDAELDIWWSRDGRGLMLLDFNYTGKPCGDFPCGAHDVYASRYVNGVVQDEKFSRIGVPYRGQEWSEVKRTLPAALGAEVSAKVAEFRRISGLEGELTMDIQLPTKGTDILVFVTGADYNENKAEYLDGRMPLYRLKWDAARGVFTPTKL